MSHMDWMLLFLLGSVNGLPVDVWPLCLHYGQKKKTGFASNGSDFISTSACNGSDVHASTRHCCSSREDTETDQWLSWPHMGVVRVGPGSPRTPNLKIEKFYVSLK